MSTDPSPEPIQLESLFTGAVKEFENGLGSNLTQLTNELKNCKSADDVIKILEEKLQEQKKAFRNFRGDDSKLMTYLKRTVHVLHSLSTSGVLGGISLVPLLHQHFPPVTVIFAGMGVLLGAIKDVSKSYDALVDLFESFESFLTRLNIYKEIPSTTEMTKVIQKILVEMLSAIALAIKQVKEGRLMKFGKKILGENDVEAVLLRLDRLTLEEAQATDARTLEVVYRLFKKIKVVMNNQRVLMDDVHRCASDQRVLMDDVHQSLVLMQELASSIKKSRRDELQKDFRKWLSPPDSSINYNIARETYHEGSAEWFVQGDTYSQWRRSSGSLLWIHGKPGSGKSILSSTIIKDIREACKAGLASMGYFFFDFKDKSKQDARGALSSLLTQFAARSDAYCKSLSALYSANDGGSQQPSKDALRECLKGMLTLQNQGRIFIILDAIDECPNSIGSPSPREEVLKLVEWLSNLHCSHLSICVTSRPEADIESVVVPIASRSISLHSESGQIEDIINYIKWFINSDPKTRKWRKEDKELVIKKLSERAEGMFRWAFCQLDSLRRCPSSRIRATLDEIPKTLDETYERALLDIDEHSWTYAHRLLQCMVVACRPLRVEELAEFLAFESEEGGCLTFREDRRSEDPRDAVLSTCSSLVAVVGVRGAQFMQFSHFSVQEYLTSTRITEGRVSRYSIPLEPAHLFVTQACLSFLLQLDEHVTREYVEDSPLALYAGEYWAEHVKFGNVSSRTEDMIKALFDPESHHFANWMWIYNTLRSISPVSDSLDRPEWVPLHLAAKHGFHRVAEWLITARSQDVNVVGVGSLTPLHIASIKARFMVAQVLLAHHADVNAAADDRETPPHSAVMYGHNEVARLLLEHDADVNSGTDTGATPLRVLSGLRDPSLELAQLLLDYGADPNIRCTYGMDSLYMALGMGNEDLVQLLLKRGANPNTRDDIGQTLLHVSSKQGDPKATQGLLKLGVDVNARDDTGHTPLQVALERDYEQVVQLLLQHGAEGG